MTKYRLLRCVFSLAVLLAVALNLYASETPCDQSLVDGLPPATTYYIYPRVPVQPFYQWQNNNGYCGEVSLVQAGLNNGEFMSQYNARLSAAAVWARRARAAAAHPITMRNYCLRTRARA